MQISMDKKYRTQGGLEVQILCTDLKGEYSVCGAVKTDGDVEKICSWTSDGRFSSIHGQHRLDLVEVSPYADFKKDDPVMVRHHGHDYWKRRYFSCVRGGMVFAFIDGGTSWSSSGMTLWPECRRPTPAELAG